jgi:glycyl-tRNA synthetase
MFLATLSRALVEETVPDAQGEDSTRIVLKIHPAIAPIKCAILPLLKNKDELTKTALEIFNHLKFSVDCQYDDKDAIGRRYRRQDAIGTPFCITVDFETLENQTVTIRERDTLKQERIHIKDIERIVLEKTDMRTLFAKFANT